MNFKEINEYVHQNSKKLLENYLEPDKSQKGFVCPNCNNGASGGTGDGIREDPHNPGRYKCFRCGFYGDVFDLIGISEGIQDNYEKFKRVCSLFDLDSEDLLSEKNTPEKPNIPTLNDFRLKALNNESDLYKDEIAKAQEILKRDLETQEYLKNRGISIQTAIKAGLGTIFSFTGLEKGILLPSSNAGFNVRNLDTDCVKEDRFRKCGVDLPFNLKNIKSHSSKPVYITEGEFDALSIIEAGEEAIALNGQGKEALLFSLQALNIERPLILALDNDQSGIKSQKSLKKLLEENNFTVFESKIIKKDYKDPNETFCKDKTYFINTLRREVSNFNRKKMNLYEKTSLEAILDEVGNNIKNNLVKPPVKTGFSRLESPEFLDGGLREGLYILGAASSIGKTTFIHQLADQIACNGQRVVFLSLEVNPKLLIAKSLSRLSYLTQKDSVRRPMSLMKVYNVHENENEIEAILELLELYSNLAQNRINLLDLNSLENTNMEKILDGYYREYETYPVLIIDYLQLLPCGNHQSQNEKQEIDQNIKLLQKISHKYQIPVIVISSFNRDTYRSSESPVNMASYYGSSSIEYTADVLLTLENTEIKHPNPDLRYVKLNILKNRNASAGNNLIFEYFPKYNYFKETDMAENNDYPVSTLKRKFKMLNITN